MLLFVSTHLHPSATLTHVREKAIRARAGEEGMNVEGEKDRGLGPGRVTEREHEKEQRESKKTSEAWLGTERGGKKQ